ncbi:MAG: hypothetical protein AAF658_07550, partial [Myxococcota bacterium]
DPVTGQATATSLQLGGSALNRLGAVAAIWRSVFLGESVQSVPDVEVPGLVNPPSVAAPALHAGEIVDPGVLVAVAKRLARSSNAGAATVGEGGRALGTLRRRLLHDTVFESELLESDFADYFSGLERAVDATLNAIRPRSPIRNTVGEQLASWRDANRRALRGGQLVSMATDGWDPTLALLAENTSASGFRFAVERNIARRALLWAVGRALGLAPNFGASSDARHHSANRWSIADAVPLPAPPDLTDPNENLEPHRRAFDQALLTRDRAGFAGGASSSVLDLPRALVLHVEGLGAYDHYALAYSTFGLAELWDNSQSPSGTTRPALAEEAVHSGNTRRTAFQIFPGGQTCAVNNDCPWSSTGARANELTQANLDAGIVQRCDVNACTSSSDLLPATGWLLVEHNSCGVEELTSDSNGWCAAWDQGSDARSVLREQALRYEQTWIVRMHRIARDRFTPVHHREELFRLIDPALRAVRPAFEDGSASGPFGGEHALVAGADLVNLLARMTAGPTANALGDIGLSAGRLEPVSNPTVTLPTGVARPQLSVYGDELQQVGQVYEALFAAEVMSARDLFPGRSTALRDGWPEEIDYGLQGGLLAPRAGTHVGPWIDCTNECDTSSVQHIDLFVGACENPFVNGECLFPSSRRENLTPIATDNPDVARWTWLLAASQLSREGDTSVDRRWAICDELEEPCPIPPDAFIEGVDFGRVVDFFFAESAFTAFGDLGEEFARSAAARRVLGASVSVELAEILGDYIGLNEPGAMAPSLGFLTNEQINFTQAFGFVLPPATNEEAVPIYDAQVRAARTVMEAIQWRERLAARLGLIENTASELERSVPAGFCIAETQLCKTADNQLGRCFSNVC